MLSSYLCDNNFKAKFGNKELTEFRISINGEYPFNKYKAKINMEKEMM